MEFDQALGQWHVGRRLQALFSKGVSISSLSIICLAVNGKKIHELFD